MASLWRVCAALLVVVVGATAVAPPAVAGTAEVALGLAAFAVAMHLARPWGFPLFVERQTTVYVYGPPPAVTTAPAGASSHPSGTVVQYSHGRYELRGDGAAVPYAWVWIPNLPPPPPPPPAP